MKWRDIFFVFVYVLFSYFVTYSPLHAVTIGSDVLVSRQNYVFFSQTDTFLGLPVAANNTIQGFVLMDQGFGLQNNATSLVYDGAFPIVQTMYLNGGTLNLVRDLPIENMTTFTSLGTINGNGRMLQFALGLDKIGDKNQISGYFNNLFLKVNSSLVLDATLTFSGISEFDGNDNVVTFDTFGRIAVAPNSELTLKNMTLNNVPDKGILCNADSAKIILENVNLVIDSLCTFSTGSLQFVDDVTFMGSGTFVLDSKLTNTIATFSTIHVTDQLYLSIAQNIISGASPFYFTDSSSAILLDNCHVYVRYPGVTFLGGSLKLDRNVTIDMASTSSAFGMVLGDGINSANDTTIYYSPSAMSIFNNGWLTYNNTNPNAFTSASNDAKIVRKPGANTYVAKNWNLANLTSIITTYTAASLVIAPGVALSFNNVDIQLPNSQFNLTGSVSNPSIFTLSGGQTLSLSKGSFLLGLQVVGTQNFIVGNGKINGPIFLAGPTAQLVWDAIGVIQANPSLNGGTLTLDKNLVLASDIVINGPGTIITNNNFVKVSAKASTMWNSPLTWVGTSGGIELNSNMMLSNVWTCSGIVIINGQGNALDLDETGRILVAPNSKLILQNIALKDATNNIQCSSNNAVIELNNVHWILDDVYTFTMGSFNVLNTVSFSGSGTFIYGSSQTSTVRENSSLEFKNNATLSIAKDFTTEREPFYYSNASSQLILDNCNLLVRYPGLNLTRGTVFINRNISIDMNSTSTDTGMVLGDGANIDNDVTVYYSPSAITTFNTGHLTYNNVSSDRFQSSSSTAKIVRNIAANMYMAKNWDLANITSQVTSNAASLLQFAPEALLRFSNVVISFPDSIFDITGAASNPLALSLNGNSYVSLYKGSYLFGLLVSGIDNAITGNGKIAGPIILTDSTAELTWDAIGLITVSPVLNGGTMILNKNLKLGPNIVLDGPGVVNFGSSVMSLDMRGASWGLPLTLQGDQGGIKLISNMILSNIWTCTGNIKIDGQYHSFDLGNTGMITVTSGCTLTLKNITLKNIAGANIYCVDDTARVILENVDVEFIGDSAFNFGSLEIFKKNKFKGGYSFSYTSSQAITIGSQSSLALDTDTTFNYAPVNNAINQFIFTDKTSKLIFNNASFVVNAVGIDFVKGMLEVYGVSSLSALGFGGFNQGITLGDGSSGSNDTILLISNGAQLVIKAGSLNYNNVDNASLIMQNNLSSIFISTNAQLDVGQNMNLGQGVVYFADQSTLVTELGADIYGALVPQGIWYRSSN